MDKKQIREYLEETARKTPGIQVDEGIVGGMPVIEGTGIPVSLVVACLRDEVVFDEISEEYGVRYEDVLRATDYVITVLDTPYRNKRPGEKKEATEDRKDEKICANCKFFKPEDFSLYGLLEKCRNTRSGIANTLEDRMCGSFKKLEPDEKCSNISEKCASCQYLETADSLRFGRIPYCGNDGKYGEENDQVSHPDHYCQGRKYEPIKVIQDWDLNFALGSAVKYIARAGRKDDAVQDLEKAIRYLKFEIEQIKEKEGSCL